MNHDKGISNNRFDPRSGTVLKIIAYLLSNYSLSPDEKKIDFILWISLKFEQKCKDCSNLHCKRSLQWLLLTDILGVSLY